MPKFHNYKNSFNTDNETVSPNDSFKTIFGTDVDMNKFREISNDPRYKKLHEKYTEIFQAGQIAGLHTGEIQILIDLYSDGLPLHEIEYRRLDDVRTFVVTNADNLLSFINPEMHAFLIRTGYFKKNPKDMTKPSRLQRISKTIQSLTKMHNSKEKLQKFAEILSRI